MEIHKPHPIHSWRELLKAVGIIVLGVLIALGAEQSADPFAVGMNDQQFLVIRSRDQGQGLVLVGHWFDDLTHTSGPSLCARGERWGVAMSQTALTLRAQS